MSFGPVRMRIVRMRSRWLEDLPGSYFRWLMFPAWVVYRTIVALRNLLFDLGLRTSRRLPIPVISIGNLVAGGSGKTPVTSLVSNLCRLRGLHPTIVSRGYRSNTSGINDEAQLMGDIPVLCNPDRFAAGLTACASGADCIVLDDGFQHRKLYRNVDIVLIDATRPWGGGAVLPMGYLREGLRSLHRADVIWITRSHLISHQKLSRLEQVLAPYRKIILHDHYVTPSLVRVQSSHPVPLDIIGVRPVLLVSGIGNPQAFELGAQALSWQLAESLRFPDHHHYDGKDVQLIVDRATNLGAAVVMTAKDAVKLRELLPKTCEAYVLIAEHILDAPGMAVLSSVLDQIFTNKPQQL